MKQREKLFVTTPEALYKKYRINTKILHEVVSIEKDRKVVVVKNLTTQEVFEESYDRLILCTGAGAFIPPIPGASASNVFQVKTVPDTDRIMSFMKAPLSKRTISACSFSLRHFAAAVAPF